MKLQNDKPVREVTKEKNTNRTILRRYFEEFVNSEFEGTVEAVILQLLAIPKQCSSWSYELFVVRIMQDVYIDCTALAFTLDLQVFS